jgi:TrmH family RNA methyltransferase
MPEAPASSSASQPVRPISGRHNPLLKDLRGVYAHGTLTEEGCYAIEGVRLMEEAIRSGIKFQAVFFSDSAAGVMERLVQQIGHKVDTLLVPAKLFKEVVTSETPQGAAALVYAKQSSLQEVLEGDQAPLLVVAAGLQDPGNLGTILRSAEAFGAGGVLLGEGTVSVYNPKTVRATAGSIFRMRTISIKMANAIPELREQGVRLFATSSHKGTPLHQAQLSGPAAFFIGNEGAGLTRELSQQMDEFVTIRQSETVESLNAGVAASIILYEAARQRKK